jgi:hypothetical protein
MSTPLLPHPNKNKKQKKTIKQQQQTKQTNKQTNKQKQTTTTNKQTNKPTKNNLKQETAAKIKTTIISSNKSNIS